MEAILPKLSVFKIVFMTKKSTRSINHLLTIISYNFWKLDQSTLLLRIKIKMYFIFWPIFFIFIVITYARKESQPQCALLTWG